MLRVRELDSRRYRANSLARARKMRVDVSGDDRERDNLIPETPYIPKVPTKESGMMDAIRVQASKLHLMLCRIIDLEKSVGTLEKNQRTVEWGFPPTPVLTQSDYDVCEDNGHECDDEDLDI